LKAIVVGGGAAGFFGAITCAQRHPEHRVLLLEKTRQVLVKVRLSGGGRCNVTHACFDPAVLVQHYPRGEKELRGPFSRFQPKDTIQWFKKRGVFLKTEEDGRLFPVTDQSDTIVHCLINEAKRAGVEIHLQCSIEAIRRSGSEGFLLKLTNGKEWECDRLLMATGSAPRVYPLLEQLGHTIIPLVPSLFTFNIPDSPFLDLAGISLSPVLVKLPAWGLEQTASLLFTHWGLSGPVILKLSAWGARDLHSVDYHTSLCVNWLPSFSEEILRQQLQEHKQRLAPRKIMTDGILSLPKQLWRRLLALAGLPEELRWGALSQRQLQEMIRQLQSTTMTMRGKTTYKQEFVTSGGIALQEVDFKTMESRCCPHLHFAGEILNIDGVTGGFNFQNAWTTGWLAGQSMIQTLNPQCGLS